MGRSVVIVGVGLVAAAIAVACAESANDDFVVVAATPDAGPDASSKLPPKSGGDDDDTTADDDDDTSPDGSAPKSDGGKSDGGPTTPGVSAACATAIAKATWNFDTAAVGWTHSPSDNAEDQANWPFDPWSRGTASTIACPSGSCWAGERTQNYAQCSRGELLSPSIDLSACASAKVTLVFAHAYAFWTGNAQGSTWFDGGIVEISKDGGATWSVPDAVYPGTLKILKAQNGSSCVSAPFHADNRKGFTGEQFTPVEVSITVPAAMLTTKTRLRFSTAAGVSTPANGEHRENTEAGWRIDDVRFVAVAP